MKQIALTLWLISFIMENNHFGWNAFPQSSGELIADLFLIIILFYILRSKYV